MKHVRFAWLLALCLGACANPEKGNVPQGLANRGLPVNLVFEDKDVRKAILEVATAGRLDVVLSNTVMGRTTAQLINVPASGALERIIVPLGYAAVQYRAGIIGVMDRQAFLHRTVAPAPAGVASAPVRVTLSFEEADLGTVLKTVATLANVTVNAAPQVQGRVTMSVKDVPWDAALDAIAQTLGYVTVYEGGGVVRVTRP